mgnify:CR=1 FL=1
MATPKIIPYTVKLRSVVTEKTFSKPPVVYTNDLRSAEFQFKITDMDAGDLSTATAKTMLYMRDGSFFQNPSTDVSRVGNVFSYLLKENEGNHAGIAKIQLVVYFNEGLANEQNFPTQLYEFEIINGLETKVAQEVMIYDWTTLTREARAYIDEFVANEIHREAEFDNNEFDRNAAFAAGQTGRTDAFNTDQTTRAQAFSDAQTARQNAYAAAESARDSDFDEAETLRQAGYDADHSRAGTDHTRADNDHTLAGQDRTKAAEDRTAAASDRTLAENDRTRAEADHTQALANNATVAGFNNRVIALESKAVKQYGIRRTLNASSTLLERLNDGIGLVANVPTDDGAAQNDFDAVYPFSQIKECIIDATGRVHYKGDPTYAAAIGDWMVEVPLYYVKDVRTETTQDEYFSAFKLDGYRIPKDFIREDGTVCQKIYYGRFKTGKDGTADVSRPGLVPSNYRDLASFRTGARAKGAGWQEIGINYVKDFLHKLYKIEFANLNSQTVFGPGITSVRYTSIDTAVLAETAVNRFVTTTAIAANFNVGNVVNIGTSLGGNNVASMRVITAINALDASNSEIVFDGAAVNIAIGNIIVMVAQKTGQTINLQKPSGKLSGISGRTSFKWRGIEDPFGNLYEWVDGVLINDNKGYICNKPSLFASSLTADYKPLSYTNANTNGYPFEMGYDENYPEAQFPIAVGAGSSTGYADYYYQNTGLRGALFGGYAALGANAGLSYWDLNYSPSDASWALGGRLMWKPPAN